MAVRYLLGAEGRTEGRSFLRFIIYVAIGGVAVGVAALLLALSIVHGFASEIEEKIVGFGAHVQVQNSFEDEPLENATYLEDSLATWGPEVQRVMPVVQDVVLLRRSAEAIDGVVLSGTPALPEYLERHLAAGTARMEAEPSGEDASSVLPGLVVGQPMAERLELSVGDRMTVFSMSGAIEEDGTPVARRPRVKQFQITGIYDTALRDFDELYVFADIGVTRELLGYDSEAVTRLDLTLQDTGQADEIAARVEEAFGFPVMAVTIYQAFSGLFAWVNLQESITPLVIAVIIIVAAFNIIGTLLMMMVEKTREIGVLESLGASARSVRRLFLMLGLLIGLVGTLIGEVLALGLGLLQEQYEVIPLPAEAYYMTRAPIELHLFDFVLVGVLALMLCAAAAYIPARVAARIDPVRAIRFQ